MKPYQNKEWLEKEYESKSGTQIAEEQGVCPQTIYNWLKKFNIPITKRGAPKNPIKYKEWKEKVSSASRRMWENLKQNPKKLERRNRKIQKIPYTLETAIEIEELYKNGVQTHEIAEKYGVSKSTVLRLMRKFKIKRNDPPPRYNPSFEPTYHLGYVLGVIYGDGSCYFKKGKWCVIRLNAADREFVEHFAQNLVKVLNRKKPLPIMKYEVEKYHKKPRKPQYTVSVRSNGLGKFINTLTLNDVKRLTNNEDFKKGFLRGFFDSDGCMSLAKVGSRNTRKADKWLKVSFCNTNKELLELIFEMLKTMGIEIIGDKIYEMNMKNRWNKKPLYRLLLRENKENIKSFMQKVGCTIARKKKNYLEWLEKYVKREV